MGKNERLRQMQDVGLEILDRGHLGYSEAHKRQQVLVEERINGSAPDGG